MNDEQKELARRLAAHPRFEFREGMKHTDTIPYLRGYGGPYTGRCEDAEDAASLNLRRNDWKEHGQEHQKLPDLTDAATGGVLAGVLGPGWVFECCTSSGGATKWKAYLRGYILAKDAAVHVGTTLAEACARALLAAWGEA